MNIFCASRSADGMLELATPPLTGTILDGNTRDSLLRLAAQLGTRTAERPVALAEITRPDSRVVEAFACGTAAAVLPVTRVVTRDGSYRVGDGRPGSLTGQLREALTGIQEGRIPDSFGWMHDVEPQADRTPITQGAP